MSHEDAVVKLPNKFKLVASTKESKFTIIENSKNFKTKTKQQKNKKHIYS